MQTSEQAQSYYSAAVLALRALEAQEGRSRRFGPEADARWDRFRGKLHDGDRLLMLLRDASVPWGIAFAASHIFRLQGVASDEPFGPSWPTPEESEARSYLGIETNPTIEACASLLGVDPLPVELPDLRPTTQLVLAGGAAILAAAHAFGGREDLDWARQVTVIADTPAPRQLAGLASVFIGAVKPCAVLTSAQSLPTGGSRVVSPDSEPACTARMGL